MITTIYGDLFASPARVLLNPVNTVGTMAAGLADEFRQIYPDMFAQYQAYCENDALSIGQVFLYRTAHKWILNVPIKKHYRASVRLDGVAQALQKIATVYADQGITSLSMPVPGVGDGVTHAEVFPLLESYLGHLPLMVYVHLPADPRLPEQRHHITTVSRWLHGTPRDIPFETFVRGVGSLARRHPAMRTLLDERPFTLQFRQEDVPPRRMSLRVTSDGQETFFLPISMLRDLWQYLILAGYAHPANLPSGMDAIGAELMTLVSRLSYVRPVLMTLRDATPVVGAHYIPPVTN